MRALMKFAASFLVFLLVLPTACGPAEPDRDDDSESRAERRAERRERWVREFIESLPEGIRLVPEGEYSYLGFVKLQDRAETGSQQTWVITYLYEDFISERQPAAAAESGDESCPAEETDDSGAEPSAGEKYYCQLLVNKNMNNEIQEITKSESEAARREGNYTGLRERINRKVFNFFLKSNWSFFSGSFDFLLFSEFCKEKLGWGDLNRAEWEGYSYYSTDEGLAFLLTDGGGVMSTAELVVATVNAMKNPQQKQVRNDVFLRAMELIDHEAGDNIISWDLERSSSEEEPWPAFIAGPDAGAEKVAEIRESLESRCISNYPEAERQYLYKLKFRTEGAAEEAEQLVSARTEDLAQHILRQFFLEFYYEREDFSLDLEGLISDLEISRDTEVISISFSLDSETLGQRLTEELMRNRQTR